MLNHLTDSINRSTFLLSASGYPDKAVSTNGMSLGLDCPTADLKYFQKWSKSNV